MFCCFGTNIWKQQNVNKIYVLKLNVIPAHKITFFILLQNRYIKTFWLDGPSKCTRKVLIMGNICGNLLDERDCSTVTLRMFPAYDIAGFDYITAFVINLSHILRNCCDNKALLVEFIQEINKFCYNLTFPW